MPLSPPAPRRHLHRRRIDLDGFLREDGLIEVEAHLTDAKTEDGHRVDGSVRPAGTPLHDMWLRMIVTQGREIVACEAAMEAAPFALCPGAAPAFGRLAGLRLEGGFVRQAMALVGGTSGCTHLREMLQQMATVVFQTLYSVGRITDDPARLTGRPPLLNSCHGWSESGDMVRTRFPQWHVATAEAEVESA